MTGVFEGVWRFGQKLFAYDSVSPLGRGFRGFVEPLSFNSAACETRDKAGVISAEEYRLIAEPSERFLCGTATKIVCGAAKFELLSVKAVFDGEKISHRECILMKVGEVIENA